MITRELLEIKPGYIIDFSLTSKAEKKKMLSSNKDKKIVSDLSCYNIEEFYNEFPNLVGTISSIFSDEHKKIEIHMRSENDTFDTYLKSQHFTLFPIEPTSGFIVPRTIAMIVNEAYFALEENIATTEDIDRAMKFGVNYPKGPFQWALNNEKKIIWILEELFLKTKDNRYIVSKLLAEKK